jgi:hypothetical protein
MSVDRYFDRFTKKQMARFLLGIMFLSTFGVAIGAGLSNMNGIMVFASISGIIGLISAAG